MQQLVPDFGDVGHSASPGLCYICGSDQQEADPGVVSTGKWIEAEGIMEICAACLIEASALVGCVGPVKAAEVAERLDALRLSNRSLGRQVKALLAENDSIRERLMDAQERLK